MRNLLCLSIIFFMSFTAGYSLTPIEVGNIASIASNPSFGYTWIPTLSPNTAQYLINVDTGQPNSQLFGPGILSPLGIDANNQPIYAQVVNNNQLDLSNFIDSPTAIKLIKVQIGFTSTSATLVQLINLVHTLQSNGFLPQISNLPIGSQVAVSPYPLPSHFAPSSLLLTPIANFMITPNPQMESLIFNTNIFNSLNFPSGLYLSVNTISFDPNQPLPPGVKLVAPEPATYLGLGTCLAFILIISKKTKLKLKA